MLPNDILDIIFHYLEKFSTVDGFLIARVDVRRRNLFGLHTSNVKLTKRGKALRFLFQNIDKLNWIGISRNPSVPVEFFREHVDKLNWSGISFNPSVPVEFFREHVDKLDWSGISRNPSIPIEFFRENIDKLDWIGISSNTFEA